MKNKFDVNYNNLDWGAFTIYCSDFDFENQTYFAQMIIAFDKGILEPYPKNMSEEVSFHDPTKAILINKNKEKLSETDRIKICLALKKEFYEQYDHDRLVKEFIEFKVKNIDKEIKKLEEKKNDWLELLA